MASASVQPGRGLHRKRKVQRASEGCNSNDKSRNRRPQNTAGNSVRWEVCTQNNSGCPYQGGPDLKHGQCRTQRQNKRSDRHEHSRGMPRRMAALIPRHHRLRGRRSAASDNLQRSPTTTYFTRCTQNAASRQAKASLPGLSSAEPTGAKTSRHDSHQCATAPARPTHRRDAC